MNEAVENVCVNLDDGSDVGPVPWSVPENFIVMIGDVMPGWVMDGMDEAFAKFVDPAEAVSGFLSAIQWVEVEMRGFPDLLEGLSRLKGALMAVGASTIGTW